MINVKNTDGSDFALFEQRIENLLPVNNEEDDTDNSSVTGLENIIMSARSGAPYLDMLICKWPEVIDALHETAPENVYTTLVSQIEDGLLDALNISLRQAKQKVHLLSALCDLAGVWDWVQVCQCLSDFADRAMQRLMNAVAKDLNIAGETDNPVPGLFVLALGKYGARELNYSSDIDLIVFYDPARIDLPNPARAERTLIRFVRKLMRSFDDITQHGYIFRTDLRLRPDPRATTVAVSTRTAERYYESLGQNWERAAMIKARPVGGDKVAATEFIGDVLSPFIWRRSLDFHAIDDVHSIKRQIQAGARPEDISAIGHDVKLGVGGIREIEFFVQVQQLILGGRNKQLRTPRTIQGLQALADGGFVNQKNARTLQEKYAVLRNTEHRIQMYADEQSHTWPREALQRMQLASLCGYENLEECEHALKATFLQVHDIYCDLFAGGEDLSTKKGSLIFTGVEAEQITLKTFKDYGFVRGAEIWQIMSDWLGGRMPATRTERARELLTRLAPRIIEACGATGSPDIAFFNFADFATKLNAGVNLFSLFLKRSAALNSLIEMLAIAPDLAQQLSARPNLIDALTHPSFFENKMQISNNCYSDIIPAGADFETAMNVVRRAVHEDQFMFAASVLRGHSPQNAGALLSDIAVAALTAMLPVAVKEVERVYGKIEGSIAVIGLGKLGGRELSLRSDLDIMLVYDDRGKDSGHDKFNKLTRRLITALSSMTEEGALYEIDMALRPSGRAGPLAVSLSAFEKYYDVDAWTWEFMALSRGRVVVATHPKFAEKIESNIAKILRTKDYGDCLSKDVLDMHQRLRIEKPGFGTWDIKNTEGGLRDIEFIAQFLMLKHKPKLVPKSTIDMLVLARDEKWIADAQANKVLNATKLYHKLLQALAVTFSGNFNPDTAPDSLKKLLFSVSKEKNFENLAHRYTKSCAEISTIFKNILQEKVKQQGG